jgi:hypothetical protein
MWRAFSKILNHGINPASLVSCLIIETEDGTLLFRYGIRRLTSSELHTPPSSSATTNHGRRTPENILFDTPTEQRRLRDRDDRTHNRSAQETKQQHKYG